MASEGDYVLPIRSLQLAQRCGNRAAHDELTCLAWCLVRDISLGFLA